MGPESLPLPALSCAPLRAEGRITLRNNEEAEVMEYFENLFDDSKPPVQQPLDFSKKRAEPNEKKKEDDEGPIPVA